jgi:hypothetical protein
MRRGWRSVSTSAACVHHPLQRLAVESVATSLASLSPPSVRPIIAFDSGELMPLLQQARLKSDMAGCLAVLHEIDQVSKLLALVDAAVARSCDGGKRDIEAFYRIVGRSGDLFPLLMSLLETREVRQANARRHIETAWPIPSTLVDAAAGQVPPEAVELALSIFAGFVHVSVFSSTLKSQQIRSVLGPATAAATAIKRGSAARFHATSLVRALCPRPPLTSDRTDTVANARRAYLAGELVSTLRPDMWPAPSKALAVASSGGGDDQDNDKDREVRALASMIMPAILLGPLAKSGETLSLSSWFSAGADLSRAIEALQAASPEEASRALALVAAPSPRERADRLINAAIDGRLPGVSLSSSPLEAAEVVVRAMLSPLGSPSSPDASLSREEVLAEADTARQMLQAKAFERMTAAPLPSAPIEGDTFFQKAGNVVKGVLVAPFFLLGHWFGK